MRATRRWPSSRERWRNETAHWPRWVTSPPQVQIQIQSHLYGPPRPAGSGRVPRVGGDSVRRAGAGGVWRGGVG